MKKIYSFLLIATVLLFSTNLKAADQSFTVSSSEWSDAPGTLKYALDQALANSGHTTTITLNENVDIPGTYNIYFGSVEKYENSKIVLNLNGHTISNSAASEVASEHIPVFRVFNGVLDLQGEGTISSPSSDLIHMYGYRDNFGSRWQPAESEDSVHFAATAANKDIEYSVLNVGEQVTLNMGGNERAISIHRLNNANTNAYKEDNIKGFSQALNNRYISQFGNLPNYSTNFKGKESMGYAMGVRVNVNGTVTCPNGQRAIQVKGDVLESQEIFWSLNSKGKVAMSTTPTQEPIEEPRNFPVINVNSGATISCSATATENEDSPAIYVGGYAIVNLKGGEISGCIGVYAKGGQLTFDGATVTSTATNYNEIEYNNAGTKGGAGAAIVFDSNTAYYSPIAAEITGNTVVNAGQNGVAIAEIQTSNDQASIADGFTHVGDGNFVISGGTFNGGAEGCLNISATLTDNIQTNGTITGGTYDEDITSIIGTKTGIITQFTNEAGETYYAISAKEDGQTWEYDLLNAGAESLVQLDANVTNVTLADAANDEIEVKYLSIPAGKTVTIPNGKTLIAGEIVLGNSTSVIRVEAGGKLIVNSQNGIISNFASSIVLETSDDAPAQLLLAPEVTSNTRPAATVILNSKAHYDGGVITYQFFGTPVSPVSDFAMNGDGSYYANIYKLGSTSLLGRVETSSSTLTPSVLGDEAAIYYMASNNPGTDMLSYTFQGNLFGNQDINAEVETNWSPLANNFTGRVDMTALVNNITAAFPGNNGTVQHSVYDYRMAGAQKIHWDAVGVLNMSGKKLNPMQPIMLKNDGAATNFTVDYENLVWNQRNTAPARQTVPSDLTKVTINVLASDGDYDVALLAQSGDFSAEYENGYDAEKYMNEAFNIYVNTDRIQQNYATDILNNTLIGFNTKKADIYTMSFSDVLGESLVLVDLENGARVNIEEGATYTFAASANETNDARFQIVEARKMPTDVETIEAVKAQKGIYSLVGAYLGEDFDVLPAGIYVVNGVKVVK